jgi:glyoxylase-like metal-dependent hydrolase (beta-lactamase superfamily II)
LVQSENHNIIVDTGKPEDKDLILDTLKHYGLRTVSIDVLVNTHLHNDHCGNNYIFKNADHFANPEEAGFDKNTIIPVHEGYKIDDYVTIIETPGHTKGSISVVVKVQEENRTYVLSGDALPIHDNYLKWVPPGINFDPEISLKSMQRIVDIADIIIPGHDRAFELEK